MQHQEQLLREREHQRDEDLDVIVISDDPQPSTSRARSSPSIFAGVDAHLLDVATVEVVDDDSSISGSSTRSFDIADFEAEEQRLRRLHTVLVSAITDSSRRELHVDPGLESEHAAEAEPEPGETAEAEHESEEPEPEPEHAAEAEPEPEETVEAEHESEESEPEPEHAEDVAPDPVLPQQESMRGALYHATLSREQQQLRRQHQHQQIRPDRVENRERMELHEWRHERDFRGLLQREFRDQEHERQDRLRELEEVGRSELICTICHESALTGRPTAIRCGHTFHFTCLAEWLRNANTCPVCRYRTTLNRCAVLY